MIDAHGSFSNFTKFDHFRWVGDLEAGLPGFRQIAVHNVELSSDVYKWCLMLDKNFANQDSDDDDDDDDDDNVYK